MYKSFQNLLFTLKKARGNPVPMVLIKEEKTGIAQTQKNTQRRKGKHGSSETMDQFLKDLEMYELIQIKGSQVIPRHPFLIEVRLSVAPNGMAFGMGSFDRDIIIPPSKRNGANHRDKVLIEIMDISRDRYEGRVVSIVEPFTTQYLGKVSSRIESGIVLIHLIDLPDSPVGILKHTGTIESDSYMIVEETGETREIAIPEDDTGKSRGNKKGNYPLYRECNVFRLVKNVPVSQSTSDHMRIAARFNIPVEYDSELIPRKRDMKKLEKAGMKDPKRVNLKKLYSCTIDGADSKDFDDAISFEKRGDKLILYVHIADVGHYVAKDTLLDMEAYKRGNSYYLKNYVLPMLPPILSEDFCSLRPKTKRLSFTCEMHYSQDGNLLEYHLYKSIIHLGKRFTYEDAEKHLEKKGSPLYDIWQLAKKLHQKRVATGKIELNIKETDLVVDAHGRILTMHEKARLNSHRLIEECMLSANICTANFMREKKIPGIYRVHDPMPASGLEKINAFLKLYGFNTQIKNLHFQQVQKIIKLVEGSEVEEIFNYILLRSFSQAAYKNMPLGHWGLGFSDYTHFTSPIRRFSDLVVHRQLFACLSGEHLPYNKKQLEVIGTETSRLERVAMDAEKTVLKLISLRHFKDKIGETYNAFFSGFNQNGLFIQTQNPRVEGFIPAASFDKRGEVFTIDDFRVKLPRFSREIALGQKFKVKLVKADWEKIQLAFEIVSIEKS
ncbi:MAG: ribonuclease R [Spirochaetia bacterium]|nr:ribonuclease R [Spirochaetia bacterium]